MIVRAQTLADVPDVIQVRARSWRAAYSGLVPTAYLLSLEPTPETIAHGEDRFRMIAERVHAYVALVDDTIQGFVVAGPDRDSGPPAGEIWAIYVDPDCWRLGIGRALLTTAVDALCKAEYEPISLWVLEGNGAARGFYEHLGFVPAGDRRYLELGAPVPEVRYILPITERH